MVAFSQRPLCYQVGLLLLLLATAVFAAGVALPWWAQTRGRASDVITSHSGLWLGCASSPAGDHCSPIDAPDWFKAVQALQCLSLMGMVVACVYAVFTNCCLDHATFSRTMELAAGIGGLLGIVSTVLYVAKTSHILRQSRDVSYSWAFGMDVAACVFVTFIAAIIALSNSRHADESASHFFLEEGSDYLGRPYRSRTRRTGRKREREMEMRPMHTASLPVTTGRAAEVIVLQNNYCADSQSQRPAANGTESSAPLPPFSAPTSCVCHPQWKTAVSGPTGRDGAVHAACSDHGHCCKSQYSMPPPDYASECPPSFHTALTYPSVPVGPSPLHHCHPSPDPKRLSSTCLPPPPAACCNCSVASSTPLQPTPQYHQQNSVELSQGKSVAKVDTDIGIYPRVTATAPPLSLQAECGDHMDYATAQYMAASDTVCVVGPRRGQ